MNATWLNRASNARLLLFFSGWGMDASAVRHLDPGHRDVLVLYDYREPDAIPHADAIAAYRIIDLVAWSLGCAAANRAAGRHRWCLATALAIAGTLTPEDDQTGIPAHWIDATTANLHKGGWEKFLARMRAPDESRPAMAYTPSPCRDINARAAELETLRHLPPPEAAIFTAAFIATRDRIIRPDAQRRCWAHYGVPTHDIAAPHNPFSRWRTWEELVRETTPSAVAPNKQRIARCFARSGDTYPAAAVQQSAMADTLLDALRTACPVGRYRQVLELGCGTGTLTHRLLNRHRLQTLHLNDITAQCERTAQQARRIAPACDIRSCPGDMEYIPLPGGNDLVISNAVLHWAADPPALLQRLGATLRPGGILATATYGPRNYREIARLTGLTLCYWTLDDWRKALAVRYEILDAAESIRTFHFPRGLDVLRHMRRTGVNALGDAAWTAGRTARLCRDYDRAYNTANGVPLTYHPLIIIARKHPAPHDKTRTGT
ncbi:pimeloyl-ACP methyl esterase BioG family protein [Desulfonatronum sp. SC1]|uniref:pimeloyl-ACP methyl esterase BioG family protein n=1 Tax=Desulfonatronum sp. SC1 TaxID=2109626 RepID=UPI000D30A3BD|nr:pimeloyl-ACP methyl esterase BioG family protein [Desulfonatronum sp. SC1]PTN36994.1 hypothetical protein C6366_07735 [Desulfonatronum sp. SC1]